MARLDVYQNGVCRFEFLLPEDRPLLLGRGPACGLVLPDPLVSREHAEVRPGGLGEGHVLSNLSSGGLRVNGEELEEARELRDEDVLEIASYKIFYRVRSSTAAVLPTLRMEGGPTLLLRLDGKKLEISHAWLETPRGKTPLRGGRQILGKAPPADIVIDDEHVSRRHAEIYFDGASWQIEDLGSTNGTKVAGRAVAKAQLSPGDPIEVGRQKLFFRLERKKEEVVGSKGERWGALLGKSAAMREIFALAERVAASHVPVLILGESGSGKELLAAGIHDASSRGGKAFIPINCGAIPEELAESELFGHEKGAFTGAAADRRGLFEEADGGTVFLDEIGDLPPPLQVKLLRVLESGEIRPVGSSLPRRVDVRVIAATHRDLPSLVREGKFREDLYYRLAVMPLRLPPLRERLEDIPLLSSVLLPPGRKLSKRAFEKLETQHFPGNVRELRNLLERAALLSRDAEIPAEAIVFDGLAMEGKREFFERYPEFAGKNLEEIEKLILAEALRKAGTQADAAKMLGIARSTLAGMIERFGLKGAPPA
ncbi:MAG: sigma 54-interacting transcriptional regulator [Bdellovibrionota bacterium]